MGARMDKRVACSEEVLDISSFVSGVYFIKIMFGKNTTTKKFMVL
jgi:hypothetical protein